MHLPGASSCRSMSAVTPLHGLVPSARSEASGSTNDRSEMNSLLDELVKAAAHVGEGATGLASGGVPAAKKSDGPRVAMTSVPAAFAGPPAKTTGTSMSSVSPSTPPKCGSVAKAPWRTTLASPSAPPIAGPVAKTMPVNSSASPLTPPKFAVPVAKAMPVTSSASPSTPPKFAGPVAKAMPGTTSSGSSEMLLRPPMPNTSGARVKAAAPNPVPAALSVSAGLHVRIFFFKHIYIYTYTDTYMSASVLILFKFIQHFFTCELFIYIHT